MNSEIENLGWYFGSQKVKSPCCQSLKWRDKVLLLSDNSAKARSTEEEQNSCTNKECVILSHIMTAFQQDKQADIEIQTDSKLATVLANF